MKKDVVWILSFVLMSVLLFGALSVGVSAITLKDSRVPLAGGEFIFDDDENAETPRSSPKTGDSMALAVLLAGVSLTVAGAGVVKKSRAR